MQSILFYDVETSGLNPAFDQVLTFAGIRTDMDLQEISREEITVRMRPDIVPAPRAFLTHCLTPEILAQGINEYQAALRIHHLINTPGTISCGYNSLGFDDEFLRFLFYRNLLDPYSHQYANQCMRMDMLPVTAVYRLFCPKVLSWPSLEEGKPTLKLEHLAGENKFETSGRAHEAMNDVEALVALSRAFAGEPKVWTYVQGFFDKNKEVQRILGLTDQINVQGEGFRIGLMVSPSFGAKVNYLAPVLHLGESLPYKKQSLWLRLDSEHLLDEMDEDEDIYSFFILRKKPGDQYFLLPTAQRFKDRLTEDALCAARKNLKRIQENPDLFLKTVAYHRAYRYPEIPNLDLDADLYQGGFFSFQEKQDIAWFHTLMGDEAFDDVQNITSPRVKNIAQRVVCRNFQNQFSLGGEFLAHVSQLSGANGETDRVIGYKNDTKLTCTEALEELEQIEAEGLETLDGVQQELFKWLKRYIPELSASLSEAP